MEEIHSSSQGFVLWRLISFGIFVLPSIDSGLHTKLQKSWGWRETLWLWLTNGVYTLPLNFVVFWYWHFQHWKLWGQMSAGNPRQEPLCLLLFPSNFLKTEGKGMAGWTLTGARATLSPRDEISLKPWAENLNFKRVQDESCGKTPSGKLENWKLEISLCVSSLRMICHWLMIVFLLPKKEYVHL